MLEVFIILGGGEIGKRIENLLKKQGCCREGFRNPMRSKGGAWGTQVMPNTAGFPGVLCACSDQSNSEEMGIFKELPSICGCFLGKKKGPDQHWNKEQNCEVYWWAHQV